MGRRSSLLLRGDTADADYHSTTVLSQASGKIFKNNPLSRSPFQPAAIDINRYRGTTCETKDRQRPYADAMRVDIFQDRTERNDVHFFLFPIRK